MKLRINCTTCDARKIDENNYSSYEKISINTEDMIVDDRSKAVLSKLPFDISAEEIRNEDQNAKTKQPISINGIYEIIPGQPLQEGNLLTVNGILKIAKGSEDVLKSFERITVNGMILCPKSISSILPLPSLMINGIIRDYPDDYTLIENNYKLDKYFPVRAGENTGYFTPGYIYDNDNETDFEKLKSANVKLIADKVYLRQSHLEAALPIFNIEAEVVEVPDACKIYISEDGKFSLQTVKSLCKDIFVIGDVTIKSEDREALESVNTLIVDGNLRIDESLVETFNSIGAKCSNLVVLKGFSLCDRPIISVDKSILDNHPEGVSVSDCALVKLDKNISADLIRERLKISDCAKINCSEEQKAAVTEVSTDVAFISSKSSGGLKSFLFKNASEPDYYDHEDRDNDTKYVNVEYYEL